MTKAKSVCWHCAAPMKKRQRVCGSCKRKHPAAVKAQMAQLTKSFGGKVPVARVVKAGKPPRPRCPQCGTKGKRTANVCARCSAPFSGAHAAIAGKAAADYEARFSGSAEWWRRRALTSHDPAEREHMLAESRKAAGGSRDGQARLLVKAAGARTLREAIARETDPHAREVMRAVAARGGYR